MGKLSNEDLAELHAVREVNDATGGKPAFIMRHHWHESGYARLVRRGLIQWGDPPQGFDRRRFAGTTITDEGRKALSEHSYA
jgi:hypothetical protein